MHEFGSFEAFGRFLEKVAVVVEADRSALDRATALIQKTAKAKIGDYQPGAGPFVPWAQLAPSTIAEKQSLGYTGQVSEDDPLLRTGDMRESIERRFDHSVGLVGSDSDVMVYQELGTRTIPPRSVLGSAAVETADKVAKIVGEQTVIALMGEHVFGGRIPIYEP